MNRTELAQLIAGGYGNDTYHIVILLLNELTEEQFQTVIKITRKVKGK